MPSPQRFSRLKLSEWRQFKQVNIAFHPTLTVLTGANSTGKTTLLNMLSTHFHWPQVLLGTPSKKTNGDTRWLADNRDLESTETPLPLRHIGELTYYTEGQERSSELTFNPAHRYQIKINNQRSIPGVFIPSHRILGRYQELSVLPLGFFPTADLLRNYVEHLRVQSIGEHSPVSPLTSMKEALIAAAIYGEGNSSVEPDSEAKAVWVGFQEVLAKALPVELEFQHLLVRLPDLVVCTKASQFLLESMSGGLNAIVDLCWQIFLQSKGQDSFTVCIDEPENHLHPSMQRSLLPQLINAFPCASFIIATHSPFIVTAVPDSNVYVLAEDDDHDGVSSYLLDTANKAATSDETLRRVLGLDTTIPLWVEERVREVISNFPTSNATKEDFEQLRQEMIEIGLRDEFPNAVDSLLQGDGQE
jgi:predicted ATPase